MAFLISIIFIFLCPFLGLAAEAPKPSAILLQPEFDWEGWSRLSSEEKERNVLWKNKSHPEHCEPLNEYQEAMTFFRNEKNEINPSEARARQLAAQISKGCNGAARRFVKTFLFLSKSGVDHPRAIEYAMMFTDTDDETVESFFEFFKKTYLGEYFDLDYSTALKMSFELSRLYKGNRKNAREDFLEISRFCLSKEGLNLPVSQCAELALKVAVWSQYYPDGVRTDFFKLYRVLREDRRFGVSVRTALRIINEVLPFGPSASSNFLKSYEYAIDPSGLSSGGMAAIRFAVMMAKNSVKNWPPPIYTPPKLVPVNTAIHEANTMGAQYQSDSAHQVDKKNQKGKP
jgi:hypothetical protein